MVSGCGWVGEGGNVTDDVNGDGYLWDGIILIIPTFGYRWAGN